MIERKQQILAFENIWKKDDHRFVEQIKMHWRDLFGIDEVEAQQRMHEVVLVIHDEHGKLAGVSTAKKVYVKQLRSYLYGVRFMILPSFRSPGLMSTLVMKTRDFLEKIHQQDLPHLSIGLIALIENEEMKKKLRAPVLASGFVYLGNSSAGHHIRVCYFRGSRIGQASGH